MLIRSFTPSDEAAVVALWHVCGLIRPWNDPHRDIARKSTEHPELFFVVEEAGVIVGTAMVGYEGHRGWVNYLAVSPDRQRQGIGQTLMAKAEQSLTALGCPKLSLLVRSSNADVQAFYRKLGYLQDDAVALGKRLIEDSRPDDVEAAE